MPATGLAQELKELANCGEIDRHKHGYYWLKGTAAKPYESSAQRAYKLVYSAADQRVREAELAVALGLSRADTGGVVSQMRKRGLFAAAKRDGFVVVSAESLAILQHGPIFDGRGKTFFVAPKRPAPSNAALPTAHPSVDAQMLAQKLAGLGNLMGEKLKVAVAATAKELGCTFADLAGGLPRSAQRYLRQESARDQWREEVRPMMEQNPQRPPKPLRELFKNLQIRRTDSKDILRSDRRAGSGFAAGKGLKDFVERARDTPAPAIRPKLKSRAN